MPIRCGGNNNGQGPDLKLKFSIKKQSEVSHQKNKYNKTTKQLNR
jgi:hypothetical protein